MPNPHAESPARIGARIQVITTLDREYRRHRRSVFAGIFAGYAAYYLVRNNLALAIPDILAEYPQHSKAELGFALTALSISYGISKFLMGSVSDRSNPKYFLPLGLLLSCAIMAASGTAKAIYASLALVFVLQALNGWVQGMGWPPVRQDDGALVQHQRARPGRLVVERLAQRRRRARGDLRVVGVTLFGDWGAKFYFNAAHRRRRGGRRLLPAPRHAAVGGLPPVEEYRNDYPPGYGADSERHVHVSARSSSSTF